MGLAAASLSNSEDFHVIVDQIEKDIAQRIRAMTLAKIGDESVGELHAGIVMLRYISTYIDLLVKKGNTARSVAVKNGWIRE